MCTYVINACLSFLIWAGLRDRDPAGVQPLADHLKGLDRLRGGQEGRELIMHSLLHPLEGLLPAYAASKKEGMAEEVEGLNESIRSITSLASEYVPSELT